MLATHWDPFLDHWGKMSQFREQMDQLLGFRDGRWPAREVAYPAVNIWEDDDHVYAEAELPGMELSDVEVYVMAGNQLTLKGERTEPLTDGAFWHRQERSFGAFSRTITLPADVERDKVEAFLRGGILTVTMPKSEADKPHKIAVKGEEVPQIGHASA